MNKVADKWNSGDPYEYFMGRWSTLMALTFLDWLNFPYDKSWLDLGCGTGALSENIYLRCNPTNLTCLDPSAEFLKKAEKRLKGNGNFVVGNASNIPVNENSFDIIAMGLSLNFFPNLKSTFSEMKRVLKQEGTIAAYVWDYSEGMEFIRFFWDAAFEIDPNSHSLDEGNRFPICDINKLKLEFENAELSNIKASYLTIETNFRNFEDYWNPFLGAQGPAPGYLASINKTLQYNLKEMLYRKLKIELNGSIKLQAKAIAIKGVCKK